MAGSARRALINALIWSLSIAAFLAIVALLSGADDDATARIACSFLAVALYSATSLSGLRVAARERTGPAELVIWGLSVAGLITALVAIWDPDVDETLARLAGALAVAAVSAAHLGLLAVRARDLDPRAIRIGETATAAAVLLLAGLAVRAIASDIDDDGYFRALGVVAILDAYGTFVIPLMRRLREQAGPGAARRGFILVLIAVLTLAAAFGIAGLVRDSVDETVTRLLVTLPFVALYGATGLAGVVVRRTPRFELLGGLTIVASGFALAAVVNLIWIADFSFESSGEGDFEWAWTLGVLAGTLAHICVLIARRRPDDSPATTLLVRGGVVAAFAAGLLLAYPVVADDAGADYGVWLSIVLIVDVLATTLVALVRKRDSATV